MYKTLLVILLLGVLSSNIDHTITSSPFKYFFYLYRVTMSKTGSRDLDKQSVLSTSLKVMVVDNKKEFLAHVGEFLSSHLFEGNYFSIILM